MQLRYHALIYIEGITSWFSWRISEVLAAVSAVWGLNGTMPVSSLVKWIVLGVAMFSLALPKGVRHSGKLEALVWLRVWVRIEAVWRARIAEKIRGALGRSTEIGKFIIYFYPTIIPKGDGGDISSIGSITWGRVGYVRNGRS